MRRIVWAAVCSVMIGLCFAGYAAPAGAAAPRAEGGTLDLSGWNFERDGTVPLAGEWMFYGGRLLPPDTDWQRVAGLPVQVPGTWNYYPEESGMKGGQGYATYRLNIRLPDGDEPFALHIPNILTAYKLWANGRELASAGRVAIEASQSRAEQTPRIVILQRGARTVELVLQVSNYEHRKGGIRQNLTVGTSQTLIAAQMKKTAITMIVLGSLLIIGFYHIGLYALRRQEGFTLYFGLLCLFVAARISVTGEAILLQWLPLGWEIGMKIDYISFALSGVAGYAYIYRLFPGEASKAFMRAALISGGALALLALSTPSIVYTKLLGGYQLYIFVVCVYSLYVMALACWRKRESAAFAMTGILAFAVTVVHDMLMYNEWLQSTELVPFGLYFFILMQALIISGRFSGALRRVGQVTGELRELNAHLEERIAQRTEELRRSNETLERTNRELERMERSRRHLITNISHDLRTPLTLVRGYLEAMKDGVVKDPKQQDKYIGMMLNKLGALNGLIQDLFELSKLEAGQIPFQFGDVKLADWAARLCEHYEIDAGTRGIKLDCSFRSGGAPWNPEHAVIRIDTARMDQVMANLIYNALDHMESGGRIHIVFDYRPRDNRLEIAVHDTGPGIDPEDMPFLFDRFYKKDKSRNSAKCSGSGLGLAIAKEIVETHGGTIEADSVPGEGSVFRIRLPAKEVKGSGGW